MRKQYFLLFFLCSIFLYNCETDRVVFLGNDSISFELFNYTGDSYANAELFIGAIDTDGNFVPTESRQYDFVPSFFSPTDMYTNLDNCEVFCNNEGLIDGYHYFTQGGEFFVLIPFSPEDNTWSPDLTPILEVSDEMGFLLRLSNGEEKRIGGFNIRATLIDNDFPVNATTRINIRETGISGGTFF
jgi:hypothetical protein